MAKSKKDHSEVEERVKNAINPALQDLGFLAGTWTMELSNASFLPDPKAVVRGNVSFEWFDHGDFLVMRQGAKGGTPYATWFIGRDQDSADYTVLYIDDRRVSRVYAMSLQKGEWRIWRNSPGWSQRFIGKLSKDKKTITGLWENKTGSKWTRDFDVKYLRNG
jgi:hypothetical protein